MSDRSKARPLPLRPNVAWRVYDIIARQSCLHIDAWLFEEGNGALYFVTETRRGGKALIAQRVLRATANGLIPIERGDQAALNFSAMMPRHINGAWAARNAPWLGTLHRDVLLPGFNAPVDGFTGYRSIALHYVWTDPRVSDPFEGVKNYYSATGYAARHGMPEPVSDPAPVQRQRSPWGRGERSLLRTLDKVIKA